MAINANEGRCNPVGALGLGDAKDRGDQANEMGDNLSRVNLGEGQRVLQISAGESHTCALLENQQIKCWGHNANGTAGQNNTDYPGDGIIGKPTETNIEVPGETSEMGDALSPINL